ncbi:MAG: glycosyltransferase [Saprospiraceae bacterium]|nr:MAG: glycosyltransferase [Saprospiraceae bacterium]
MKILVLASRFPYPLEKGDKLRMYFQIRELSKYHDIVLCALTEEEVSNKDKAQLEPFCSAIYILPLRKVRIFLNLFKALFNRQPFQVAYFFDARLRRKIHRVIEQEKPGHIYCQLIRTAGFARDIPIPKTLDYMDNFSAWTGKIARQISFPANLFWRWESRKVAAFEQAVFPHFDHHTIISKQDRDALGFDGKNAIHCVPNGVDTEFFQPICKPEMRRYNIAFAGNMGYYNNVKAAVMLVNDIMPLVWEVRPGASVLLAGARPSAGVLRLVQSNVRVSGWLDDIRDAYASAAIFVAPILLAVGLQNKILEAMSMGLPCITTSRINEAVGATPGEEILLADEASGFAAHILALIDDEPERRRLGVAGQSFVRKNFSWQQAVQQLNDLITERE